MSAPAVQDQIAIYPVGQSGQGAGASPGILERETVQQNVARVVDLTPIDRIFYSVHLIGSVCLDKTSGN